MAISAAVAPTLRFVRQFIRLPKNSGTVTIPRNIGISYATGEYIAHVDDDVFCLPNKFGALSKALNDNPNSVMAYGNRIVKNLNGTFSEGGSPHHVLNKQDLGIDGGQFIYRANVYDSILPNFSINACDWHTYSKFAHLGDFTYVNETVCIYNWHGGNISLIPKAKRPDPLTILPEFLGYFNKSFLKKVEQCLK